MKKNLEKFKKKVKDFEKQHTQIFLHNKKRKIIYTCRQAHKKMKNKAKFHLKADKESISICITAKNLTICDESKDIKNLFSTSNYIKIDISKKKVRILLWFRCWTWIKKDSVKR